jgi:hypothetical protein
MYKNNKYIDRHGPNGPRDDVTECHIVKRLTNYSFLKFAWRFSKNAEIPSLRS